MISFMSYIPFGQIEGLIENSDFEKLFNYDPDEAEKNNKKNDDAKGYRSRRIRRNRSRVNNPMNNSSDSPNLELRVPTNLFERARVVKKDMLLNEYKRKRIDRFKPNKSVYISTTNNRTEFL